MGADTFTFVYNGLGDRLRQTINAVPQNYTLDIEAGLTQVLADGSSLHIFGRSRLGEVREERPVFNLIDHLGSVRQTTDITGNVEHAARFEPFGRLLMTSGPGALQVGFAGEQSDLPPLIFLRHRYLDTDQGRFLTEDKWRGDPERPSTQNGWDYVSGNPVNRIDPTGLCLVELSEVDYRACIALQAQLSREAEAEANAQLQAIVGQLNNWFYNGSLTHSGQMRNWEADYQLLGRDVTKPPPGLSWSPSISINTGGARNIAPGGDQFNLVEYPYGPVPIPLPAELQSNARCGQIILAAILETVLEGGQVEAIIRAIGLDVRASTYNYQLAGAVRDAFGPSWDYWIYGYGTRYKLNMDGSHRDENSNDLLHASYSIELMQDLRERLRDGRFLVMLVQVIGSIGTLRPFGITQSEAGASGATQTVGHWVLLTGMSSQWNYSDRDWYKNWVRIYNPYWDRTEYYYWGEFRRSVNTGQMLEIWRADK